LLFLAADGRTGASGGGSELRAASLGSCTTGFDEEREMIEVRWQSQRPKASTLRALCESAERYRPQLLVEWEQKVLVVAPGASR
jgi:hypothetical protein